jgi:hypothetical protein
MGETRILRGADGRQRWIRAADLRPASGSKTLSASRSILMAIYSSLTDTQGTFPGVSSGRGSAYVATRCGSRP